MFNRLFYKHSAFLFALVLILGASASVVYATHSWGGYHWARTSNSLALKLGNNLSRDWSGFLQIASDDWSLSTVLDTAIVAGQSNPKSCRPIAGRVEICNSKYGKTGWLGVAQIWISGNHITQGAVKMNDTYFNTSKYNNPAWKQFVVCQEVGHVFGMDHQDENFDNINLGTCMDYTNDPTGTLGTNGTLNNKHPNQHDYDELVKIYTHLDAIDTVYSKVTSSEAVVDLNDPSAWGEAVRESLDKKTSVFERDLGNNNKVFTFVIWVNE